MISFPCTTKLSLDFFRSKVNISAASQVQYLSNMERRKNR